MTSVRAAMVFAVMYIKVMTKIDAYFYDNYRENGELAYTTTMATIEDMLI